MKTSNLLSFKTPWAIALLVLVVGLWSGCQTAYAGYSYTITSINILEVNGVATSTSWNNKVFRAAGGGRTVKVEATITTGDPNKAGKRVYWSYDDPDEPSGYVPNDADSLGGNNLGSPGNFDRASSLTDANGKARAIFTLSDYGGDNYKLKAAKDAAGGGAVATATITVWKRLVFERPDSLVGYSTDVSLVTAEFQKIYVQIEENQGTGDAISTARPEFTTGSGGAYGPNSDAGLDSLAGAYNDPVPADSPSGMGDYQNIGVRAEGSHLNGISTVSKEPYSSSTTYTFGKPPGSQVLDYNSQGDLSTIEVSDASPGYATQADSNLLWIYIYHDEIAVEALMFGASKAQYLKRIFWHEAGHTLGLDESSFGTDTTSIMNQMPVITSQADIDRSRVLVTDMHWSDNEATLVRRDWQG